MEIKRIFIGYKNLLILSAAAVAIGLLAGAADTLFGRVLLYVSEVRAARPYVFIPFLPLAGAGMIVLYNKAGGGSIKGMALIFEAGHGDADEIPLRMAPFAAAGTWLTHLFGGSAGREGVAVQIGGTIAHSIGRRLKIKNGGRIMLITGMAAGFAGLFQTPVAAAFFALEVLTAGALEYGAILPAVIAAFVASHTSHLLGLEKFTAALNESITIDLPFVMKLAVLGIAFGVTGGLFAAALHKTKALLAERFKSPIARIFVMGIFISAFSLLCHGGRYSGLGTNLISASFGAGVLKYDFALKFIFTVVSLSAGFQGGEVTPLFAIGASLGAVLAPLFGVSPAFAAALGYVCVFGSATNTFLAPVFIGAEVFGYEYMPYFFAACVLAYVSSGSKSIYPLQKKRSGSFMA